MTCARRAELVQQLLEPEFVRLVDGDEQQLVMSRRIGLRHLLGEQLRQPEVTAVGQPAALFAETAVRRRPGPAR